MRRALLVIIGLCTLSALLLGVQTIRTVWSEVGRALGVPEYLRWESGLLAHGDADLLTTQREELARVKAEVSLLRQRLLEYDSIEGEGRVVPETVVLARGNVLARERTVGRRYVHLDVGFSTGIDNGLAVVSGWSLAGRVVGVQRGRSLVQLITDTDSAVPGLLFNDEELVAEGLVVGTGKRGGLEMHYVEDRPGLEVVPGMTVMTSGVDWQVPRFLAVGVVESAVREAHSDHWRITLRPFRPIDIMASYQVLRAKDVVTKALQVPELSDSNTAEVVE